MSNNDQDAPIEHIITPSSPPPSFRSHTSSPTFQHDQVDQTLADTFDADGLDSDDDNDGDDRQRLMRGTPQESSSEGESASGATHTDNNGRPVIERRVTHMPAFTPSAPGRVYGGGSGSDGVFANLSAKPESGEKVEEHPPVR